MQAGQAYRSRSNRKSDFGDLRCVVCKGCQLGRDNLHGRFLGRVWIGFELSEG